MDLVELRVKDFLAYADSRLSLAGSGLTLLVGPNNSGKSAFLAAFDVIAEGDFRRPWRRIGSSNPAQVTATFEPDEGERHLFVGETAHPVWLEGEALNRIDIEWQDGRPDEMVLTGVSLVDKDGLRRRFLQVTHDVQGNVVVSLVSTIIPNLFQNPPDQTQWDLTERRRGGPVGKASNELRSWFPGLGERLAAWQECYYHFAPVRAGVQERSRLGAIVSRLEPTGFNLAQVLLYQQSRDSVEWRQIRRILAEILPDAGMLLARADRDDVEVTFQDADTGATLNVKQLGAGVEQALMAVYVGVTQPVGSVVVMEEPEAGLHPGAQRLLFEHLREWAKTRQFLVSTHSPVFLDHASQRDAEIYLVRRHAGVSTLGRSAVADASVLSSLGIRLSDVASAERILVVEGDSDAAVIHAWFPRALQEAGVAIVGAGGGDKAWHSKTIVRVLERADALSRTLIFVRDRDELGAESAARLRASGSVWLLHRRELENYLLDPDAIAAVLRDSIDATASPSYIETELLRLAEGFRNTVQIKMTADKLRPVRVLDRAAVARLVEMEAGIDGMGELVAQRWVQVATVDEQVRHAWDETKHILAEVWPIRKLDLAPGADLLEAIWHNRGRRFDKQRDGSAIAAAMAGPPDEFVDLMNRLMSEGPLHG